MATKALSAREEKIVSLCIEGLTNEGIAHKLGISVGTVNTYWLRIKLKVGGLGRADMIARVVKDRADHVLSEAKADMAGIEAVVRAGIDFLIHEHEADEFLHRASLGLLHLVVERIRVAFWAADNELRVHIIGNKLSSSIPFGPAMTIGQTIYDVFGSRDRDNPAIACHLDALNGKESTARLHGEFENSLLHVAPLTDEDGDVIGCVGVLSSGSPQPAGATDAQGDL